ncbi:arginyltransferase [Alteromonas aestuariivivens]|uniref:Aspartate/glutamate leucyltransferase n=1 Tax=Alteromonas aestuariivivens TaxID=1938339 RepID=A0A3D8M8E4_9ALTE|nr:arginyltransferase [Alteromonas aestuariivivens]RDV26165.1 arginyltransferase [Alteromonas aestuariivivens]
MKFGITQAFSCSYLPQQHEQLLVYADEDMNQAWRYGQLIQVGFRRSGDQIYRPHCPRCQACESIRIPVDDFLPSRSQRRILKKNKSFESRFSRTPAEQYYRLYEKYINCRHADGTMFPPSREQFDSFIQCRWKPPVFIEAYDQNDLIAVAVTDDINAGSDQQALSALYTFFDPNREKDSIGTWMILQQISFARQLGRKYLYLGYHVAGCRKMDYKQNFIPHERFSDNKWQRNAKKVP